MDELDLTTGCDKPARALGERFSAVNGLGQQVSFTDQSMIVDGKPFFGISGEIHYARIAPDQWEDTLIKAKCGGINLVTTYVFWNVHEEVEGHFRFDGCRDMRRFITLCRKHDLRVILRIGPFDHGEMRNGGLPDWLYGKPFEVRNNNEGYLACVRRLYAAIHSQADGLYFSQGGPIVGIQLENEYMHSAAPWEITTGVSNEWVEGGHDGEDHIRRLKQIAQDIGLITPFYTCTAWGGGMAPVDEVLPLWGGYAYWPWIFYARTGEHPCTPEYIYRDNHNDAVKKTYNFEPRYAPESMPYACCEMMGGMMCGYNYRFSLDFDSVDALANIKLGSGCAMLGYYMYRGGTTPTGERTPFLNESQVCKRSYDYQAPIGEFGQRRMSYDRLRTLHDFCTTFADELLGSRTILPDGSEAMLPEDQTSLRFCARVKQGSGFLFINDFQDHLTLPSRHDERITLKLPGETIEFAIDIASGENAILPFNLQMGQALLKHASLQPITHMQLDGTETWFFMIPDGMKPVMCFDPATVQRLRGIDGTTRAEGLMLCPATTDVTDFFVNDLHIVVMTRAEACRFSHITRTQGALAILSDSGVLWDGQEASLESMDAPQQVLTMPAVLGTTIRRGPFAGRVFEPSHAAPVCPELRQVGPSRWVVDVPQEALLGHKTVLLRVKYMGDIGQAFINGEMIHDNFCNGQPWDIRLDCYAEQLAQHPLTLYIVPVKQGASVNVDSTMAARMEHVQGSLASLDAVSLVTVDTTVLPL